MKIFPSTMNGSRGWHSSGAAIVLALFLVGTAAPAAWEPLPKVDFSQIKPSDFNDDELDLVGPLANFHLIAEGVLEEGPDRGFLNVKVWRDPASNKTYNSRVMENVLSLAWFYTTKRSWNPYYSSNALRQRLEAALEFIAKRQASDGSFTEKSEDATSLAPTAFMTKFLGETLELLCTPGAPEIDPSVLEQAKATMRRAVEAVLTLDNFYRSGERFTNQYGNVWVGGQAWFHLNPDEPELKSKWDKRFHQSLSDFQSSAGFFYELNGPDFGYTLHTHESNTRGAWKYLKGTAYEQPLLEAENKWFEFLSYNTVLEPGTNWFAVNRAIETRQKYPVLHPYQSSLAREIPGLTSFTITNEERTKALEEERSRLAKDWPGAEPLDINHREAFTPYLFLNRRDTAYYPGKSERDAAWAKLPYLARDRFNHVRYDRKKKVDYFYLRRPAYYATFTEGAIAESKKQSYGLGLFWQPETGIVMQGQPHSEDLAWGTYAAGRNSPFEASSFSAVVTIDRRELAKPLATGNLAEGDLGLSYPIGANGRKALIFTDAGIEVRIELSESFSEVIPLIVKDDENVAVTNDSVVISGPKGNVLTVGMVGNVGTPKIRWEEGPLPQRRLARIQIEGNGKLEYRFVCGQGKSR